MTNKIFEAGLIFFNHNCACCTHLLNMKKNGVIWTQMKRGSQRALDVRGGKSRKKMFADWTKEDVAMIRVSIQVGVDCYSLFFPTVLLFSRGAFRLVNSINQRERQLTVLQLFSTQWCVSSSASVYFEIFKR